MCSILGYCEMYLWPKTPSYILLVTENQLLHKDLLESAGLHGTEHGRYNPAHELCSGEQWN